MPKAKDQPPLIGPERGTVTHGLLLLRRSLGIDRAGEGLALLFNHEKRKLKAAALRELATRQGREARAHRASAAARAAVDKREEAATKREAAAREAVAKREEAVKRAEAERSSAAERKAAGKAEVEAIIEAVEAEAEAAETER